MTRWGDYRLQGIEPCGSPDGRSFAFSPLGTPTPQAWVSSLFRFSS
jgi:hypothetical protein